MHIEGYTPTDMDRIASSLLGDLFLWQGDFAVSTASGAPVLNDRERAHMRDVRGVFAGFELFVLASVAVLAVAFRRERDADARSTAWRAVGRGARGLAIGLVVIGAFAAFAFDAAFEVFHRLFFSAGTYTFDPRTDHLVQLFPEQFWSETAIVLVIAILPLAIAVSLIASARSRTRASSAETVRVATRPDGTTA